VTGESCAKCHIGTLRPRQSTLTYWAGDQLVVIPNQQAWVCDVCADVLTETDPIEQLETLLGVAPGFPASVERHRSTGLPAETLSLIALRRRSV
jgi:YgiT-type zinc finger domain-containing protein